MIKSKLKIMNNYKQRINDYLKQELLRNKLAKEKRLEDLKKTYYLPNKNLLNPNTNKFWDRKISESNKIPDEITKKRVNIVYKLIPKQTKSLLDIGIGYGYLETLLHENKLNINITGLDISEKAVENLRKNFEFKLLVRDLKNFPKELGKFDVVIAMEVFEHILPHKIFNILANIKKSLKSNGIFIITVPLLTNNPDIKMTFPYDSSNHVRLYSKELISSELEIAGFKIDETKEIYAFPNYKKIRNLINLIFKRWNPNILIIKASIK